MPFAAQGWNYSESTGFSTFHALQAQYQQRFSHGLETLVAFTWEKCLANSNGDFGAENGSEGNPVQYYFTPRLAKGVCAFDIPKVFTVTAIYQLPFGRGKNHLNHGVLSAVARQLGDQLHLPRAQRQGLQSDLGRRQQHLRLADRDRLRAGVDRRSAPNSNDPANLSNADGSITGYSRPSVLSGCQLIPDKQTVSQWYNPACFVSPHRPQ